MVGNGRTVSGIHTVDKCKDHCLAMTSCVGFEFVRNKQHCSIHVKDFLTSLKENIDTDVYMRVKCSAVSEDDLNNFGKQIIDVLSFPNFERLRNTTCFYRIYDVLASGRFDLGRFGQLFFGR